MSLSSCAFDTQSAVMCLHAIICDQQLIGTMLLVSSNSIAFYSVVYSYYNIRAV
jgi:hypothetical protein